MKSSNMEKIDKQFTVTMTAKQAGDIIKKYIKEKNGLDVDDVEFHIEPLTNDYGDYASQEVDVIVCTGKIG